MFTIDWDTTSTFARDKLIPRIVDQFFKSNAMMYRLRPRAKIFQGGRSIVQPLSFAPEGGGGQWWAGTDPFDTRIRSPFTAAQYFAKNFELPIVVSQEDEDIVDGPDAAFDLVESKMQVAQRTLMDSLGGINGIYNDGSNPKAITGLQYSLKDGSAGTTPPTMTYAGISSSPTLNTWWNHKVDHTAYTTGGGANNYVQAATFSPWDKLFMQQSLDAGKSSSLILCNWGVFNDILQLVNSKTTWFQPQQNAEMAKAGFRTFMYAQKTIVVDEQVPRNATTKIEHVYFIDEDAMTLWVHARRNFSFEPWRQFVDQAVRVAYLWFRGELTFSERRSSGVHSNVNTTNTSP